MKTNLDSGSVLVDSLVEALHLALGRVRDIRVVAEKPRLRSRYHYMEIILAAEPSVRTALEIIAVARQIYPRDVRNIIWNTNHKKYTNAAELGGNIVPLVLAESISEGARELLMENRVGYCDVGGNLYIPGERFHIQIDKPALKSDRPIRSLFNGKRAQVVHGLLTSQRRWFGVAETASLAGVSPSTAFETLTMLDRMEWMVSRGHGPAKERLLQDPAALLDEWRSHVLSASNAVARQRYFVPSNGLNNLISKAINICHSSNIQFVVTDDYAAQCYMPFLSDISRLVLRLPGSGASAQVAAGLNAQVVAEGSNLEIIETRTQSEFLFGHVRGDMHLASPVQTYLDLLRGRGRSRDMAAQLRAELLRY